MCREIIIDIHSDSRFSARRDVLSCLFLYLPYQSKDLLCTVRPQYLLKGLDLLTLVRCQDSPASSHPLSSNLRSLNIEIAALEGKLADLRRDWSE